MKIQFPIFLLVFFLASFGEIYATSGQIFTTTAYYSPTPFQSYYLYGSYEAEKQMQGEGVAGASGEKVFLGMLAGPSTYAFGTKILLEGLGVGSIADRGGAISTSSGANDRLDIWMGFGEEGLKKAIAWGRRDIAGTIVDAGENVTLDISNIDTSKVRFSSTQSGTQGKVPAQTSRPLTKFQSELFEKLSALGYTGATLTEKIIQYQLDNEIIASRGDSGAGIYGPKTRASLEAISENTGNSSTENTVVQSLILENQAWNTRYHEAFAVVETFGNPTLGDVGEHVRNLQIFLRERNYLAVKDTAYFGPLTEEALQKYQKAHDISPSGKIDVATKDAMILDLIDS